MSAWLGLVPKQYSTGGKSNLGGISKRGNAYLRMMVIQGARALMIHMKRDQSRMGLWLREVEQRSHPHVALIALANKIVRICWKVLTSQQSYQPFVEVAAVTRASSSATVLFCEPCTADDTEPLTGMPKARLKKQSVMTERFIGLGVRGFHHGQQSRTARTGRIH